MSPEVMSDEEVVEAAIDWMEEAGFSLQPWQATAFRAIMLCKDPCRLRGYRYNLVCTCLPDRTISHFCMIHGDPTQSGGCK